jgi:2-iminobutanoate/2-iminopropanoate deaminase
MEIIKTAKAPDAIGPYSQAIKADGVVYCSGQIALRCDGTLVKNDIKEQTVQVFENLREILGAAGSSPGKVLKTTVYMTDLSMFSDMNEVYGRFFGDHRPARATVGVGNLPRGALIEIECIALAD